MKKKITALVLSVALLSVPVTSFAWKTWGERYPQKLPSGGAAVKTFNDKGLPAPLVDAPTPRPVEGRINITLNGEYEYFTDAPVNIEGRVLLPFRDLFEFFQMKVTWNGEERKATAEGNGKTIELTVDGTEAYVNGSAKTLDVPAKIINGRTYVPVRFVAEALEYDVGWNQDMQTVMITIPEGEDE